YARMYRKFLAAIVALVIGVGAIFAEEIKAVFVKYDEGKLTVKVDDKDKTFKDAKDAVYKGKKEVPLDELAKNKAKEGAKLIVNTEKDEVTWVKADKE